MELFLRLAKLAADTEDLAEIIDKAGDFLIGTSVGYGEGQTRNAELVSWHVSTARIDQPGAVRGLVSQFAESDSSTIICFPRASAYRSSVANVGFGSSLFSNRDNAARSMPVRS